MKKRVIAIASTIALTGCLGLFGCGGDEPAAIADNESAQTEGATEAAESAEEAPASDYEVTIDGAEVMEDYEGNPAVVVTYSWVNNSEEATSAAVALNAKVFQNGVQLEPAVVSEDIEGDGYMAEVKPGAGTSYGLAYVLDDQSDITVEVSELISFDDTVLAEATFSVA